MLKINAWDELGAKWAEWSLDLPSDCKDVKVINRAFEEMILGVKLEDGAEQEWAVDSSARGDAVLVIETRTTRGHLGIILVNYEDQDDS